MDPKSRTAYELVRTSWIDAIKYHGFSEEYDRASYEKARSRWTQYTDGDDWHAAGTEAHRAHWARQGHACNRTGCDLHDDEPADKCDGSVLAADYLGDGVYQPETDPVKLAAAEKSINALRAQLTKPRSW